MKVIKMTDVPTNPNPHGIETRKFHENDYVQPVNITLKPGEKLKKHITPVDAFFYVLECTGIVEIGDEKKNVEKDTYIDSPAMIPHCWYNEGNEELRILVVKAPKPANTTQIL
jgi:mannose-6-phosphate isomerase-like protein (cupin superfamily)